MEALQVLRFTDDSGIGGAICYMTEDVQLTEVHIRLIIEAKSLMEEGTYAEPRLSWWDASKFW